ncbi:MAG: geranylgeranylglycerol-phosphate geranylgeranyltransferase [Cyanobacteria bacterium P01_G01_bin.4]
MVRYCDPRHTLSRQVQAFGRLFRWPVGLFAGLAGCATIYSLDSSTPFASYWLTAVVLSCMYSAACAINDYWDVDTDRINHPDRPLPSGRLTQQQARMGATSLFAVAAIAALHLGLMPFLWVAVAIPLLWYYSQIVKYSGILGNVIVAIFVAALIVFAGLVVHRPLALLPATGLLSIYQWVKEIIWDVRDATGDGARGITTIATRWGGQTALAIAWGAMAGLSGSIPIAPIVVPMAHPVWFASCTTAMITSLAIALAGSGGVPAAIADRRFTILERLSMVFGILSLLGAAPR